MSQTGSQKRYPRLEELFERALQLDPESRRAFVAEQCTGDDDLRDMLEGMLAADVSRQWLSLGREPGEPGASPPELPAIGQKFDRYTVLQELGRGGMGAVFLARDEKLDRDVALKFMLGSDQAMQQRFRVEARVTAQCTHENIVVIHDIGEYAAYYSYLVLEYVRGSTLRQVLRERRTPRMTTAEALDIMIPLVRALVRAHDMGIVHRDLKPENIMIADSGPIKVMDFGVAKNLTGDLFTTVASLREQRVSHTLTGLAVGTLPYMSPEQWGVAPVDHRSDIWAVGIMLFELLAGRHPITPSSIDRLHEVVANLTVPMPRAADIESDIGGLAAVIDRCLRKPKAERFESGSVLLQVLQTIRDSASPDAPKVGEELTVPARLGEVTVDGRGPDHDRVQEEIPAGTDQLEFAHVTLARAAVGRDADSRAVSGWRMRDARAADSPFTVRCTAWLELEPDAEDSSLVLDATLINLYQRPVLLTALGLQLVSVHWDFTSGDRAFPSQAPKSSRVVRADHFVFDAHAFPMLLAPHRKRVLTHLRKSLAEARASGDSAATERVLSKQGEQLLDVRETCWHELADPVYQPAGAPYRYSLRVDAVRECMPVRSIVRLCARSQLGVGYSAPVELSMTARS